MPDGFEPEFDFIALTTAITRPELHRVTIPSQIEWFAGARVLWIINVDPVHPERVDETLDTLRALTSTQPNLTVRILTPESPCLFSAARRLASIASQELPRCRVGVVWMEDDWARIRQGALARMCKRVITSTLVGWRRSRLHLTLPDLALDPEVVGSSEGGCWFVSLVDSINVSLSPGLWSKRMFSEGVVKPLEASQKTLDPEKLCYPATAALTFKLRVNGVFRDMGEYWRAGTPLAKWDHTALSGDGPVTYQNQPDRGIKFPRQLSGYAIAAGFRGETRSQAVHVSPSTDGSWLTVQVTGVPEVSRIRLCSTDQAIEVWESPPGWIKPISTCLRPIGIEYAPDESGMRLGIHRGTNPGEMTSFSLLPTPGFRGIVLAAWQSVAYWTFRKWRRLAQGLCAHRAFLAAQLADLEGQSGRWAAQKPTVKDR